MSELVRKIGFEHVGNVFLRNSFRMTIADRFLKLLVVRKIKIVIRFSAFFVFGVVDVQLKERVGKIEIFLGEEGLIELFFVGPSPVEVVEIVHVIQELVRLNHFTVTIIHNIEKRPESSNNIINNESNNEKNKKDKIKNLIHSLL